jgi:LPXTG-motif cell wall-anchored protein
MNNLEVSRTYHEHDAHSTIAEQDIINHSWPQAGDAVAYSLVWMGMALIGAGVLLLELTKPRR